MEDQVYYSNWSDVLSSGHENYWDDINDISIMIGNDLIGPYQMNYYLEKNDSYLKQLSSIAVLQTKEKFGEVRVYCMLACDSIISEKYKVEFSKAFNKNKEWKDFIAFGKKPKNYSRGWEDRMSEAYPIEAKGKESFSQECEVYDAKHYRRTYLKYFRLFPHYKKAIRSGATYPEYLFDNKKEAKEYLDSLKKNLVSSANIIKKVYNIE